MEITGADQPLAYVEFRMQNQSGRDAVITRAYTYADLARITGYLPTGMMFLVSMYCNEVRVGSGVYKKDLSRVQLLRESGACKNLFKYESLVAPALEDPPLPA